MRYSFIVSGSVSQAVTTALPEMSSSAFPTGGTALFGPVKDEADALTMLALINGLGLAVVEMRRLPD